ncbi:hypothetical protein K488DRAFT_80365 [Vararia minispora EC-137]|uniref:Uncharacterized protein n=1 Tax=Vararia minispora EC-137 TaxID=1314806 RepID=A0ACB8QC13_9AGAM|nr:hypothetical protein K488DRAFT_80365 [Vararia minispora EC-137]
MSMKAVRAQSGDSLILRGRPGPQGQPPKERILHLADISCPRMGNSSREDEPWAYEAREFLRSLAVGKECTFASAHQLPPSSTDDISRDLGSAEVGGQDLATELLRAGWARMKDAPGKREPTEDEVRKRDLETEARGAGRGIWNPHGPKSRQVVYTMPLDSSAFMTEWKGKILDGIVEAVKDGSTFRIRLIMPEGEHQFINLALAGVRAPRVAAKPGESSEAWGDEARFFAESRLLQRPVKVQLLSLPGATPSPFQSNGNGAPAPASIFIGNVLHPAGNIAEFLVGAGLARVVDWHAGMLAASGGMERLRAAERSARERKAALYASTPAAANGKDTTAPGSSVPRQFDGQVVRVWSGDQISIVDRDGKERRVQLSSTRGPKLSDPKQAYYAHEAREFLRRRLIGKHVRVTVDFIRPREGEYEEREAATVRYGNQQSNIAEQLIEKGLAAVVRHKRDDEDRSPDYDKLMAAEQTAVTETRGIHSGKEHPAPRAPLNLSDAPHRATQFLNGFKRQGRIPAVVEFVAGGSRFKILLPKDNQVLTLVLGGIRAPRTARNPSEKSEPYGAEAAEFATRRYMQRDVEIEIDAVDKAGGFIGALYVNKTENAAVALVREGLAHVHPFSAESLSWQKQLYDAEEAAKREHKNVWSDYDAEAEARKVAEAKADEAAPARPEYIDVIVSDVRTKNGFGFSVQILNTEGIASLEKLMRDFSLHHRGPSSVPPNFAPKAGDLVSARFSDGAWYRARIRRSSPIKREAEVTFIDYGNQDTLGFDAIRPLDPKFRTLPGQAHDARLSFVRVLGEESEYHQDAVNHFRLLCEGRKLIAILDSKEGTTLHLRLIDPASPATTSDPLACVNADLLREGLAALDRKGCARYFAAHPDVVRFLQGAVADAKKDRLGRFEFGDVEEDE